MVTFWGQSAGAASGAIHMTNIKSAGLFHRVSYTVAVCRLHVRVSYTVAVCRLHVRVSYTVVVCRLHVRC